MGARFALASALGVALLWLAAPMAAAQTLPSSFPGATAGATPEIAVQGAVQAGQAAYAGDCAATTPANIGQLCSKYVADHGSLKAYLVGLTFSEFTDWVFVKQTQAGWAPVADAPFDGTASTLTIPWPATYSSSSSSSFAAISLRRRC